MSRPRTRAVAAAVAGGVLLLAGCSSGSSGSSSSASASASSSSASASSSPGADASAGPVFNPCDGLDAAKVSRALGSAVRVEKGSADTPRCALLPAEEGDPTVEVNYSWFPGGLEAAWRTMGIEGERVRTPRIAGADDARVVVNRTDDAYAVSGFVQNGDLIQTVNALALAPYDAAKVDAAVAEVLTELSAAAPEAAH